MSLQQNQVIFIGIAVTTATVLVGLALWSRKRSKIDESSPSSGSDKTGTKDSDPSPAKTQGKDFPDATETTTPLVSNKRDADKEADRAIHAKIEELDKTGKKLFKEKKYYEAAQYFSEALDLIESEGGGTKDSSSPLYRQMITLMNNRSAMYEKGNFQELALDDCDKILELDPKHTKARTRKLRILEGQKNYKDALVEVCAVQLLFMQENRDKLRLGLPTPPPQVPQSKLEELLTNLVPGEVDKYMEILKAVPKSERPLPSKYTILQLLKSYSGFHSWMSKVAKRGAMSKLKAELPAESPSTDSDSKAKRASALLKIGERHVYDGSFKEARDVFEDAYTLVNDSESVQAALPDDDYPRILEWTGMVRHWIYDLDEAKKCFQKCAEIESVNAEILVKEACVEMDGGKHDEALKLFDDALKIDPGAADALLHRANLRMLQQKIEEAKSDLQNCLELRPDNVLARLRLASIFTATNDVNSAKKHLDMAEKIDPDSSEICSYRGEILFTDGNYSEAQEHFERAIQLSPDNPTPYVNAALTVLNKAPPSGQIPDTDKAIDLLEKAIEVDPQFHAAYVQLGQLKLGTAQTLIAAKDVVALYDKGIKYCRTADELKDLVSMRILTVAQVEAATQLKMETFNMQ